MLGNQTVLDHSSLLSPIFCHHQSLSFSPGLIFILSSNPTALSSLAIFHGNLFPPRAVAPSCSWQFKLPSITTSKCHLPTVPDAPSGNRFFSSLHTSNPHHPHHPVFRFSKILATFAVFQKNFWSKLVEILENGKLILPDKTDI